MTESDRLTQLQADFSQWRMTRKGRGKIPLELKQRAVGLLASYKISTILNALGLNHSTFKKWQHNEESPQPFIALPSPVSVDSSSTNDSMKLTVKVSHYDVKVEGAPASLATWVKLLVQEEG